MKWNESFFWLLLIAVPIMMLANVGIVSSDATTLYVDPSLNYAKPGESFTVDIRVAEVVNLYGWQVNMSFDPSVLDVVNVTEGEFLMGQPNGTTGDERIENERGFALFSWRTLGKYEGVDGSGILATVQFTTLIQGETVLNITDRLTYLQEMATVGGGHIPREIPSTKENGYFSSLITPPVAEFTSSSERPRKNEIVTFDASASYDDEEIVSYGWDFGDNTTEIYKGANLTATATHQYTTPGTKNVILNVTDNIGLSTIKTVKVWVRFTHDIALLSVEPSAMEVEAGETVSISVVVTNQGEEAESFDVTVYLDGEPLETKPVTNLEPDIEKSLIFNWNTAEAAADEPVSYGISAEAEVAGEGYTKNNVKGAGTVTVNPPEQMLPMTLIIAVVVIVIVIGVGAFLYSKR